ncbi:MAG: FHA domain-containing protein [Planctomycetes bacterium]|nr:FHA domain-containing protein [Planctomycetota bacterium]
MRIELTEPRASACDVRLEDGEQIFVGRAPSCEIHVPCKSVSKRHARLIRQGDQVVVEDLDSRNGLRVNGVEVASALLEPGDVLQLGRAVLRLKGRGLLSSADDSGFRLLENEPELQPRLVLIGDASSSWDLSESSTIGCRPENAICLSALGVSRFHAEVVQQGEQWVIQDLGATNGVVVNGERVDSAVLQPGDEITIGETRMRFELHAPGARSLRGKLRAALAVAAALLLGATGVSAMGGPAAEQGVAQADTADLGPGLRALVAGRYVEAQEALRASETLADSDTRSRSRTLRKLAREFERLDTTPEGFLWERPEELVASALRMDLGEEVEAWLRAQRSFLQLNRDAAARLDAARDRAEAARREPELELALEAFMDAAVSFEAIAADARCHARAERAAAQAREAAVARVSSDLKGLEAQEPPAWVALREVAARGLEFTQDVQQRLAFRQLIARAERERVAAATLARAQEALVGGRREAALRELEQIPATSYYAGERDALVQRGALATLLQRAQRLYSRGSGQQARDLLDEAFDLELLPLEVVQREVGALRRAWIAVEREFARGSRAAQAGERSLACEAFSEVLRLEPDPANGYHSRARKQLAYLTAAIRDELESELRGIERTLELPLESLRRAELSEASQRIRRVQEHPALSPAEADRVRAAVELLAARLDVRERVKDALLRDDADALERLGAQMAFLDSWLPVEPEGPKGATEEAPGVRGDLAWAQKRLNQRLARSATTRRLAQASK